MLNDSLEKELAKLNPEQKLDLVEHLWASLDASALAEPMSDELFGELERRSKWADDHPEESMTFEEVAKEMGAKK